MRLNFFKIFNNLLFISLFRNDRKTLFFSSLAIITATLYSFLQSRLYLSLSLFLKQDSSISLYNLSFLAVICFLFSITSLLLSYRLVAVATSRSLSKYYSFYIQSTSNLMRSSGNSLLQSHILSYSTSLQKSFEYLLVFISQSILLVFLLPSVFIISPILSSTFILLFFILYFLPTFLLRPILFRLSSTIVRSIKSLSTFLQDSAKSALFFGFLNLHLAMKITLMKQTYAFVLHNLMPTSLLLSRSLL